MDEIEIINILLVFNLLRNIEKLNNGCQPLPVNSCLVTANILGSYQNIPPKKGIKCLKEALEERRKKRYSFRIDFKANGIGFKVQLI